MSVYEDFYFMKNKLLGIARIMSILCVFTAGCSIGQKPFQKNIEYDDEGEPFVENTNDKDFSELTTPGSMEKAYEYKNFFLPGLCGTNQPYVGDCMAYYEDGTYYIYYLKDGGDSYNHSVFLTKTTDFVTYEEVEGPVLEADKAGGQDAWIGTGSVVKIGDEYLFFYTGHGSHPTCEYAETIKVARGTSPTEFEKDETFEIIPPDELGQKNDFRDPQAYYDEETGNIVLTVTASKDNVARILKYTLSSDLKEVTYDGVIFDDPTKEFWNLECSDTFKIGDKYYITYSAQDDTLWYAVSDTPYGPYENAARIDGKLFYAAKHVEGPDGMYMVAWARRSDSPSDIMGVTAWAGNLIVMKICQNEDGSLYLAPVDKIVEQYKDRRKPLMAQDDVNITAGSRYYYEEYFNCYESFMLTGKFTYSGNGSFGLAFDYNGNSDNYKMISIDTRTQLLDLNFNEGTTDITSTSVSLTEGETYSFTYIQEGSVGVFYIDGQASLTVRLYGVSGKSIRLFAEDCTVDYTDLREYTR